MNYVPRLAQAMHVLGIPQVKATRGGGGVRVKNEVRLFLKISWSRAGCRKPHQKILFQAEVMNF